jgi:CubicO group peptidase (beta-lactamase class C family)
MMELEKKVRPESVGLSGKRLGRIGEAVQRRIDKGEIAGAVSVVARKGKVAHLLCQGASDVEAGVPMRPDTLFRIYSMSKPVTAAALLTLYEEGHFKLDDPIGSFIPELSHFNVVTGGSLEAPILVPLETPVTLRQLFTHSAGICYPNQAGTLAERLMEQAVMGPQHEEADGPLDEFVRRLARAPLAHQPGAAWTYGFSTDVLGRLIEVISGKSFDAFLSERIFTPLGMEDTFFFVPPEKHDRLGKVYAPRAGGGVEVVEWATHAFSTKKLFLSGGGGLVSSASDYLQFASMLLGSGELDGVRVLGRRTVDLMFSGHIPQLMDRPEIRDGSAFGPGQTYGLGGRVLVDESKGLFGSIGTYGWDGLASTTFWVDRKEELVAMLFPQMIPGPAGMHEQFRTLVYQALI